MTMRFPWDEMKSEYVEGLPQTGGGTYWPTLTEIGKKYGASPGTVRMRSAREGWSDERKHYVAKIEHARQEAKTEVLAADAAAFDHECLRGARGGVKLVLAELARLTRDYRESKGSLFDRDLLAKLSQSLEKFQRVGRHALGEDMAENEVVVKLPPELTPRGPQHGGS